MVKGKSSRWMITFGVPYHDETEMPSYGDVKRRYHGDLLDRHGIIWDFRGSAFHMPHYAKIDEFFWSIYEESSEMTDGIGGMIHQISPRTLGSG